jgi:hypothetical protein
MEREKLRAMVDSELEHIPKGPGIDQGLLRAAYNMARQHSLGSRGTGDQTANDVLEGCIRVLKKEHPDACFIYDRDFFKGSE